MTAPLDPLPASGDTSPVEASPPWSDTLSACGITWDGYDIARFLHLCDLDPETGCLIWRGARSRGQGNTAWYGTFYTQGKSVRAHKFYAVAVLGLRPRTGVHHLDHTCPNSLCVSCIQQVPEFINLKLRWIRVQVGLDEDRVREAVVQYLLEDTGKWVDDYNPEDFAHWITDQNRWRFEQELLDWRLKQTDKDRACCPQ